MDNIIQLTLVISSGIFLVTFPITALILWHRRTVMLYKAGIYDFYGTTFISNHTKK